MQVAFDPAPLGVDRRHDPRPALGQLGDPALAAPRSGRPASMPRASRRSSACTPTTPDRSRKSSTSPGDEGVRQQRSVGGMPSKGSPSAHDTSQAGRPPPTPSTSSPHDQPAQQPDGHAQRQIAQRPPAAPIASSAAGSRRSRRASNRASRPAAAAALALPRNGSATSRKTSSTGAVTDPQRPPRRAAAAPSTAERMPSFAPLAQPYPDEDHHRQHDQAEHDLGSDAHVRLDQRPFSPRRYPAITKMVFQIALPAVVSSSEREQGMRSTPAGIEIRLRKIGNHPPEEHRLPCRA